MRTNISAVMLFQECPRKWYYKYILGRGEEKASDALSDGKLWHAVCAGEIPLPPDAPDWMGRAHEELEAWVAAHPDVEILGNEIPLERALGRHFIFGRLDRLVRWNGKLWHWQHKTLSGTVPIPVYTRMVARSYHEHAYKYLVGAQRNGETFATAPYGGTILAIARKVTQNPRRGEPKNPLVVEYLSLPDSGPMLKDLISVIDLMDRYAPPPSSAGGTGIPLTLSSALQPPQNPGACGGAFRNSLCEYIDVCDMRRSITTMGTIDPLEGYAK